MGRLWTSQGNHQALQHIFGLRVVPGGQSSFENTEIHTKRWAFSERVNGQRHKLRESDLILDNVIRLQV
jgi:hypothetical protein